MFEASGVLCKPTANVFQGPYHTSLTKTQIKPFSKSGGYHRAGDGRDAFIQIDGGGQQEAYKPAPSAPLGSLFSQKRRPNGPPNPILKARTNWYQADGSGRDSYVGKDSGGHHNAYRDHESVTVFTGSLRSINRPVNAFQKHGGKSVGLNKTLSQSTFVIDGEKGLNYKNLGNSSSKLLGAKIDVSQDLLTKVQLHYNKNFNIQQKKTADYQRTLDVRLARPKTGRPGRIENKTLPSKCYPSFHDVLK